MCSKGHDINNKFIIRRLSLFKDSKFIIAWNESAMAYEPVSKILAVGFGSYKYEPRKHIERNALQLWDVSKVDKPRIIEEYAMEKFTFKDLRFSPNGKYLAGAIGEYHLNIWRFDGFLELTRSYHLESVPTELSWRSDSKYLVASTWDGYVVIFDATTMVLKYLEIVEDALWGISWRPDGKVVAVGSHEGYLMFVNPYNGKVVFKEMWHDSEIHHLRWSPDGKFLVYGQDPWLVFVRPDGDLLGSIILGGTDDIEVSPNGKHVAAVYFDDDLSETVVAVLEARYEQFFGEVLYEDAPIVKKWPVKGAFDVEWLSDDKLVVLDNDGRLSIIEMKLPLK